jgi:nitrous oxidase accessory protein NosD
MQVTLSREVKLPIDGVQFSNNLFGITLTASTYEEAKAMIDEAFSDFTESTKLISKAHVDKAYVQ